MDSTWFVYEEFIEHYSDGGILTTLKYLLVCFAFVE